MLKKRFFYISTLLIVAVLIVSFLTFPRILSTSVHTSLLLCFTSVIPSLFPFLVVTKLILKLKLMRPLEKYCKCIMRPLFSVSENAFPALLLGLISGYPVGASLAAELYKEGAISKRECSRILSFCNNAGPSFILGVVGNGLFSSLEFGLLLLIIHISSAVLCGFLLGQLRPIKHSENKSKKANENTPGFSFAFTDSVYQALISSLTICSYIVFFSVICHLITSTPLLANMPPLIHSAVCGILEITSAIYEIAHAIEPKAAFIFIAFLLGWGGICVHFQALSFFAETGIRTGEYFIGKLLHATLSALLAVICVSLPFFDSVTVFSNIRPHFFAPKNHVFLIAVLLLFCLFFKKGWKNRQN